MRSHCASVRIVRIKADPVFSLESHFFSRSGIPFVMNVYSPCARGREKTKPPICSGGFVFRVGAAVHFSRDI